jgi:signal transduction histidine kinase
VTTLQAMTAAPAARVHRWQVALGFAASITVFLLAHHAGLAENTAAALNDISWLLASAVAAFLCWRVSTASTLSRRERRAWRTLCSACAAWFIGQAIWTYYEVALGQLPSFPHWMQTFFSLYDWVFIAGLWLLPRPQGVAGFTPRHIGNLLLIVCTLGVAFIVALLEPAAQPMRNQGSNLVAGLHCIGLATMFITALYLLWSYRWEGLYWPLVYMVVGAGIHTATYIAYIHQLMTDSYVANDWLNVSWLFVFGAYACAAHERLWQEQYSRERSAASLQHRERWLEALIPALLILIMLAMVWFYSDWLSPRAAGWATSVALLFAVVLGIREYWIQQQEQQLLAALSQVNEGMLAVNRELSQSEARYRTLNMELEHRVTERTMELQQAYRELENFSYAVAHDLKAPLRSIDGFGAMLADGYSDKLDDTGRRYVDRMRRSALRMSDLIDDLLAYARVDQRELQYSSLRIATALDKVIAEQHDEIERHGVQLRVNATDLAVRADAEGLHLACRNLLQNAIKFSRDAKPPSVAIDVAEQDDGVCIAVRDNGIGFDMSHHEKIFEMFQRLHRAEDIPGTGIGLAIVRKAVERMGGRVWASSAPGAGATFYLHLPAADAQSSIAANT